MGESPRLGCDGAGREICSAFVRRAHLRLRRRWESRGHPRRLRPGARSPARDGWGAFAGCSWCPRHQLSGGSWHRAQLAPGTAQRKLEEEQVHAGELPQNLSAFPSTTSASWHSISAVGPADHLSAGAALPPPRPAVSLSLPCGFLHCFSPSAILCLAFPTSVATNTHMHYLLPPSHPEAYLYRAWLLPSLPESAGGAGRGWQRPQPNMFLLEHRLAEKGCLLLWLLPSVLRAQSSGEARPRSMLCQQVRLLSEEPLGWDGPSSIAGSKRGCEHPSTRRRMHLLPTALTSLQSPSL